MTSSGAELVNTRWLAAPPERVFAAFADERQRDAWWGPHGFTTTTLESDLRPGGTCKKGTRSTM